MKDEAEHVAYGQTDDEVGQEGIGHHGFDAGYAAQGVGEGVLQYITELIYNKDNDEHGNQLLHFCVVVEEESYFVAKQ